MNNKKGILLTLLTIVLFVLMLGELVSYIVININFEQLTSSVAATSSLSTFLSNVNGGSSSLLSSSLHNALGALAAYGGTPSLRKYNFVNGSAAALESLMTNGTIYGSNMSAYMYGATLDNYLGAAQKEAGANGWTLSFTNASLSVYQTQPFYLSATMTAFALLNSSYGSTSFPINATVSIPINGTSDIAGAQRGDSLLIKDTNAYPNVTLVGNTTAQSGSRSPFMFASGTVIYIGGTPTCNNVPAQYQNKNYILVTPNAIDIGQAACGMAGLVTNTLNASAPLVPYLSYKLCKTNICGGSSGLSFNSIQNGTRLLLNGAALALYDTAQLKAAMHDGYYYPSISSPSYLDSIQSSITRGSQAGIFSFNLMNRETASFNGATSQIATGTSLSTQSFTVTLWVKGASTSTMEGSTGYTVFSASGSPAIDLWLYSGGGTGAPGGSGDERLGIGSNVYPFYGINGNSWHFVAITVSSGVAILYSDLNENYTIKVAAGPYSLSSLDLGAAAGSHGAFDGNMSNVQVYSTALTPQQIAHVYLNGLDGSPIHNSSLYAWYPLNGNANDYSGGNHNGTPTAMTYALLSGYTADPIFENLPNRFNTSAVKGVLGCTNLNSCINSSIQNLDLGPRLLTTSNGAAENETTALGIPNGTTPNGLSFEDPSTNYLKTINGYSAPTALTISAWIYPSAPVSTNAGDPINSNPTTTWTLGYTSAGGIHFFCGNGVKVDLSNTITYGSWQNLVMVCQNSGGNTAYTIYLNGSLVATGSTSGNIKAVTNLIFGNYSNANSFDGILSDVHLYGSALTAQQVQQLYLNDSVNGVTPLGWWPMSSPYDGYLNQTQDVAGGNLAASNSCAQYQAVYQQCAWFTQT